MSCIAHRHKYATYMAWLYAYANGVLVAAPIIVFDMNKACNLLKLVQANR